MHIRINYSIDIGNDFRRALNFWETYPDPVPKEDKWLDPTVMEPASRLQLQKHFRYYGFTKIDEIKGLWGEFTGDFLRGPIEKGQGA